MVKERETRERLCEQACECKLIQIFFTPKESITEVVILGDVEAEITCDFRIRRVDYDVDMMIPGVLERVKKIF